MKFAKTRLVKSPSRGTQLSAGIDFYVPKFNEHFLHDLLAKNPEIRLSTELETEFESSHVGDGFIVIMPHDRILIPSGIHVNFTEESKLIGSILGLSENEFGLSLNANNKSGVASKKGLSFLASVVDQDYQNEIHINVVNTSNYPVIIKEDEKLIQFLLQPVFFNKLKEVELKNLYQSESERGLGGFGSTDNK